MYTLSCKDTYYKILAACHLLWLLWLQKKSLIDQKIAAVGSQKYTVYTSLIKWFDEGRTGYVVLVHFTFDLSGNKKKKVLFQVFF